MQAAGLAAQAPPRNALSCTQADLATSTLSFSLNVLARPLFRTTSRNVNSTASPSYPSFQKHPLSPSLSLRPSQVLARSPTYSSRVSSLPLFPNPPTLSIALPTMHDSSTQLDRVSSLALIQSHRLSPSLSLRPPIHSSRFSSLPLLRFPSTLSISLPTMHDSSFNSFASPP